MLKKNTISTTITITSPYEERKEGRKEEPFFEKNNNIICMKKR